MNGSISEPLLLFKDFNTLEAALYHPPRMAKGEIEAVTKPLESYKYELLGSDKDRCYVMGECANTWNEDIL